MGMQNYIEFYHGTSDIIAIKEFLLPPIYTDVKRELGRIKLVDCVFLTTSLLSACGYANKACNRFGGNPIVYVVEPIGDVSHVMNNEYIVEKGIIKDMIIIEENKRWI